MLLIYLLLNTAAVSIYEQTLQQRVSNILRDLHGLLSAESCEAILGIGYCY